MGTAFVQRHSTARHVVASDAGLQDVIDLDAPLERVYTSVVDRQEGPYSILRMRIDAGPT